MPKTTAAQRRQQRQENVNLEFLLRRTRRQIYNETPAVIDQTVTSAPIDLLRVSMSKHAIERCAEMNIEPELVRELVAHPAICYQQRERWIAQHAKLNVAAIYAETDVGRLVVTVLFREPFTRPVA